MASDWLGVSIAPDDSLFDPSPTWERLDTGDNYTTGLRVAEIKIDRGRQSEFEETNTGTCVVSFHDQAGVLDPTNASSPYYGKLMSRPLAIAIRNPITDVWFPLFRGVIDEAGYDLKPSKVAFDTQLTAVDGFDYFANFELVPGLAGLTNDGGTLYYENDLFNQALFAIVGDSDFDLDMTSIFSGNVEVDVREYSPGDSMLQALFECLDAEFPTVANMYFDTRGIMQIHGRYARFDPVGVSAEASNWVFQDWKVGDNAACLADATRARLKPPFGFSESRKEIRNIALAYPAKLDRADLADFVFPDAGARPTTSMSRHGIRTWTAENIPIVRGTTTGNGAKAECLLFSEYIVNNYDTPYARLRQMTIGTEHPDNPFAGATWEMLCEADISDRVNVLVTHPGEGGFDEVNHFIEGVHYEIRPMVKDLDTGYPYVRLTCDLSPEARWLNMPFPPRPT